MFNHRTFFKLCGLMLILAVIFLLPACEPTEENGEEEPANGDANEETNDAQPAIPFTGEEALSGEVKEFPHDWEGQPAYLNFFSLT